MTFSEGDPCPSCGCKEWYIDYHRSGDGELRVDHCEDCDWPPGTPMSPQEWRADPTNPLNLPWIDRIDKSNRLRDIRMAE